VTTPSIADVLDRALAAESALEEQGTEIADEWQYVTDLAGAWRARLEAVRSARGDEDAPPGSPEAIVAAIDEAGLIEDPHRAIDWLSTFPQIVLGALGERT
jgi:hypothetical protein